MTDKEELTTNHQPLTTKDKLIWSGAIILIVLIILLPLCILGTCNDTVPSMTLANTTNKDYQSTINWANIPFVDTIIVHHVEDFSYDSEKRILTVECGGNESSPIANNSYLMGYQAGLRDCMNRTSP